MLQVISPIAKVWRRPMPVSDADISTNTGAANDAGQALSLDEQTVDIVEGQWVTKDANGLATLVTTPTPLAFCVYAGGVRRDVNLIGQVDGLVGDYVARTDQYDASTGTSYAPGDQLTVENGILREAAGAEPVVAIVDEAPSDPTDEYPNGLLQFVTV
jgi:hypothetical protein